MPFAEIVPTKINRKASRTRLVVGPVPEETEKQPVYTLDELCEMTLVGFKKLKSQGYTHATLTDLYIQLTDRHGNHLDRFADGRTFSEAHVVIQRYSPAAQTYKL